MRQNDKPPVKGQWPSCLNFSTSDTVSDCGVKHTQHSRLDVLFTPLCSCHTQCYLQITCHYWSKGTQTWSNGVPHARYVKKHTCHFLIPTHLEVWLTHRKHVHMYTGRHRGSYRLHVRRVFKVPALHTMKPKKVRRNRYAKVHPGKAHKNSITFTFCRQDTKCKQKRK